MKRWLAQLYSILALFALVHFVSLLGLGGYAYATGRINREKIKEIAEMIKPAVQHPTTQEAQEQNSTAPLGSAETSAQKISEAIEAEEKERYAGQWSKVQLQRAQDILDRRTISFQREKEEWEKQKLAWEDQDRKKQEQNLSSSYQGAVQTISAMAPKSARDALMKIGETDAVKILLELDERKRQRIFESCKLPEETVWRDKMLMSMLKQPVASKDSNSRQDKPK